MGQTSSRTAPIFGIGAVARMTGLTDHTLRIWERRYQAVVAARAANGRRVYQAVDVDKLNLLKTLTDQGHSIGQIANESIDELSTRVDAARRLSSQTLSKDIRTAVLGEFIPAKFESLARNVGSLRVIVSDNDADRFAADLRQVEADVVILELSTINPETPARLQKLMDLCGARRGIVIYTFARSTDLDGLRNAGAIPLRSPLSAEDIEAAVVRAYQDSEPGEKAAARPAAPEPIAGQARQADIAPRHFSQRQLAKLASTASDIACECPQHLAQLVADLGAFEVYSAQCTNRDDDDAELHRYLHDQTAAARTLIEASLRRVVAAERIDY